jgi:inorganic pyrophosphatase
MELTIDKLLPIIDSGVEIKVERRRFFDYGFPRSHFEIKDYINPADGDPWDVLVFGYDRRFEFGETFHTSNIVGIIFVQGGNHKLIFKIPDLKGFNLNKFNTDISRYMKNYKVNGLRLNYIEF